MSRERFILHPQTGELVPAHLYVRPNVNRFGRAPMYMPDSASFISPIDNTEVGGRAALREHEKRHDVIQIGSERIKSPDQGDPGGDARPDVARAFNAAGL